MKKIRCSLGYHSYRSKYYITICTRIENGIYNNSEVFNSPPIEIEVFKAVFLKYSDTAAKFINAYKIERTNLDNCRNDMNIILDQLSEYVDKVAKGDASIIILAGFIPTKGTVDKSKLLAPTNDFEVVRTNIAGKFIVNINTYNTEGSVWYFCLCCEEGNVPPSIITNNIFDISKLAKAGWIEMSKARKKEYTNLIGGKTYSFYVFVANTAGVSLLSDPKSITV